MPSTGAEKLRQQGVRRKRELEAREARDKRELRVARDKRRAGDLITKALSEANELQDTNSQLRSQLQGIRMQSEAAEAQLAALRAQLAHFTQASVSTKGAFALFPLPCYVKFDFGHVIPTTFLWSTFWCAQRQRHSKQFCRWKPRKIRKYGQHSRLLVRSLTWCWTCQPPWKGPGAFVQLAKSTCRL